MIAALFVDPAGVYANRPDVDVWGIDRDARLYPGPHPVVAHPPCQLWGRFAAINFKRWGGDHNRPGNDGGCFASALASVRQYGGVLQHPAGSLAWTYYRLMKPTRWPGWSLSGGRFGRPEWTCEVAQSAYGHAARKLTWLLYVGECEPIAMRWEKPEGTHQIGFHDQRGRDRNKPTISGRKASATPPDFAQTLLALAHRSTELRRVIA